MMSNQAPIAVGVLFSAQGLTSAVEVTQRNAVLMAIDEINRAGGVLGRELIAVEGDSRSDPRRAATEVTRMLDAGVRTVFGCDMSSTRRAVLPIVERRGGLLFYPTLYEGFEYSDHCIYSGAAPNQNSIPLADYAAAHFGRRYYLVGSNYVFPYESNRIMRDYLRSGIGTVIEERYIPLRWKPEQIDAVIADIARKAPVTVFSTTVGEASTALYRAYARAGFDRTTMPIISLTTGEPEVAAMGSDVAEGHVTAAPYFSSIDSAANARFVSAYRLRHGAEAPISAPSEAAYFQVHLYALAVARAGSVDVRVVRETLPSCVYEAPQGMVRIDAQTHHTTLWPRIGRVRADGAFDIIHANLEPMAPDPYMILPEPRLRAVCG